jgi:rare lipoprotein A
MSAESNRDESKSSWVPCYFFFFLCLMLAGCQSRLVIDSSPDGRMAQIYSNTPSLVEYGMASWYGERWIGRLTANGETYRIGDMTAAHRKLPFNTQVRVVDLKTANSVIVRVNNRGPYVKGRIIDLSVAAAKKLGTYDRGIAKVRIEALREIPLLTKSNVRALNPPKPPFTKPLLKSQPIKQRPNVLKSN